MFISSDGSTQLVLCYEPDFADGVCFFSRTADVYSAARQRRKGRCFDITRYFEVIDASSSVTDAAAFASLSAGELGGDCSAGEHGYSSVGF